MTASGKTTLLDILSGYLLRYTGSIELDGTDSRKNATAYRKKVAYIPQGGALYPEMTIQEYMRFLCSINHIRGEKRKQAIEEALAFAGLGRIAEYPIQALSARDRARVAVAASLAQKPKVLLIDQPFFGLRTDEIEEHRKFLKAVAQQVTLIVAADNISGFSDICKRTIILNKGRMVSRGQSNLFAMPERRMRIRMRVASVPAQVRAAMQFVPGVAELDFRSTPEAGVWDVVIHGSSGEDIRSQIWMAAATFKVPVLEMRSMSISPEDIFLQLSGLGQDEGV